jgi:hypothetical protein
MISDSHRCELCDQPAYYQVWDTSESRWLRLCVDHETRKDLVASELKRSDADAK